MAEQTSLSPRAMNRLKLAANLLRSDGYKFGSPFYDEVIKTLGSLPTGRLQEIKELVDWVEAYEGSIQEKTWNRYRGFFQSHQFVIQMAPKSLSGTS